jgi:hypothetical protein
MPYVSMHTTGDPIGPLNNKDCTSSTRCRRAPPFESNALTVSRYGHCNFAPGDLTAGLALLLQKIEGPPFTELTAAGTVIRSATVGLRRTSRYRHRSRALR